MKAVALVTGAAGGMGQAIVRRLALDGFRVVAVDRGEAPLRALADRLRDEGLEIEPRVADLADEVAGTSVNLTVARGGFASNVIAERAVVTVDMRVLKASEGQRVERAVRDYSPRDSRVTFEVAGGLNRPPLERTPANEELLELANSGAADLGLELDVAVVGGGSDGNFTSALGIATLDGLGSVGSGPHARDEHIRVRETLERVALVSWLLAES